MNKGVLDLLKQRYLIEWNIKGKKKQETPEMMFMRVAKKMASGILNLPTNKYKHLSRQDKLNLINRKVMEFYSVMLKGDFIPSSPQMFNALRGFDPDYLDEEKYNIIYKQFDKMLLKDYEQLAEFKNPKAAYGSCYSMGQIGDSISDIYRVLTEQAEIFRAAGGFGVSFSALREKNALVKSIQGESCGPIGFMELFNDNTKLIALTGKLRRGRNCFIVKGK